MAPAELPRGAGKTAVAIEKKHRQPQKKECAAGEPVRAGAVRGDWGGGKRFITTQTIAAVSSKAARVFTKHAGCGKGMPVCFWRAAALRKKAAKRCSAAKKRTASLSFFIQEFLPLSKGDTAHMAAGEKKNGWVELKTKSPSPKRALCASVRCVFFSGNPACAGKEALITGF